MLSDKFVFRSSGEAQKMEFALARNGFTYPLFEKLVEGSFMGLVREVLEGKAEICRIKRLASLGASVQKNFPTWKTVKLGTHKSVKEPSKALTNGGFRISDWAADILKKITLAQSKTEIELVNVSVAELGFTKAARRDVIYDRAKELGLDLVPAEVGPHLRLQYADQPVGEWLNMAMEPIADSVGRLRVFGVGRGGDGLWLYTSYGLSGDGWDPDCRCVFARRK